MTMPILIGGGLLFMVCMWFVLWVAKFYCDHQCEIDSHNERLRDAFDRINQLEKTQRQLCAVVTTLVLGKESPPIPESKE